MVNSLRKKLTGDDAIDYAEFVYWMCMTRYRQLRITAWTGRCISQWSKQWKNTDFDPTSPKPLIQF